MGCRRRGPRRRTEAGFEQAGLAMVEVVRVEGSVGLGLERGGAWVGRLGRRVWDLRSEGARMKVEAAVRLRKAAGLLEVFLGSVSGVDHLGVYVVEQTVANRVKTFNCFVKTIADSRSRGLD